MCVAGCNCCLLLLVAVAVCRSVLSLVGVEKLVAEYLTMEMYGVVEYSDRIRVVLGFFVNVNIYIFAYVFRSLLFCVFIFNEFEFY